MKSLSCQILAVIFLSAGVLANLAAQIPDWYATHKNPRYPSEMYILGVGAASGTNATEAAKKAAQTDLVSQIRVQVQAQVKNVSESFQFNKNEQLFSDFRSNVRTAVNDEIAGMEVVETKTDNATGTAYALVVLERDKYCENLKNEMDAGWKQADELRASSSRYANQGRLDDALQSLLDARSALTPLMTKQTLYNAVSNEAYKPPANFGPSTISLDIRQILGNIRLVKKSGDKQKGKIGEGFPEPFVVQATFNKDGKNVPVVGSTVLFETSTRSKLADAITDEMGLASLSTTIRAVTGNGISARLTFKKLDREFEQSFVSSAVNFTWKAEASNVLFALRVESKSTKIVTSLKNAFSSAITQIGYKVVGSSKYVLNVAVEAGESSKVDGMAGTMYSVSTNVVATLADKNADNTLGSVTFSGKGLARSESEATEKAVSNVKINQKDLSELLEKALQK